MTTGSPSLAILVVHERYREYGGEDAAVDAQVRMLEGAGHRVELIEVDNDTIDDTSGVAGRVRLAATTIWSTTGIRRVTKAVRAMRPDVVHVHNTFPLLSPAIYGPSRALGPAVVQTLHNFRLVCPNGVLFRDGHPCQDCVGKPVALPGVVHACYRDSVLASGVVAGMLAVHRIRGTWRHDIDRFVALSWFARDRLIRGGVPPSRMRVLRNFVDEPSAPDGDAGEDLLFVGRLTEDKGVPILLDAWRSARIPGRLRIAGDGPLGPLVRKAASEPESRIDALGRLAREATLAEMRRARAVVVPSQWYENCPMTVIEAFACGRPVIATRHGGLAEMVEDGGTGLLVDPRDVAGLTASLARAAADPDLMLVMGRAARRRYEEAYSPDVAYRALIDVYVEAIEHRRRAS